MKQKFFIRKEYLHIPNFQHTSLIIPVAGNKCNFIATHPTELPMPQFFIIGNTSINPSFYYKRPREITSENRHTIHCSAREKSRRPNQQASVVLPSIPSEEQVLAQWPASAISWNKITNTDCYFATHAFNHLFLSCFYGIKGILNKFSKANRATYFSKKLSLLKHGKLEQFKYKSYKKSNLKSEI